MSEKVVILGSGPAGLTAGIYAGRSGLDPLIIDGNKPGGQLMTTSAVENWPGEVSIPGPALMENMRTHAGTYGARFLDASVTGVDLSQRPFLLTTNSPQPAENKIATQTLIIATGAQPKKLCIPGEETYWARGVSTCAVCDGTFYRDKAVVIVGGGDTAMETASFMTKFTKNITIVHILPKLTATHAMQQRVINDHRIKIIYNSTVTAIRGTADATTHETGPGSPPLIRNDLREAHAEPIVSMSHKVTHIIIKNQKTGEESSLPAEGVFIAIGIIPNTSLFKGQLELNDYGYILLKEHTQTSVSGVFAAGDVADSRYRQAITSAGHGCAAAMDAERFLSEQSHVD